MARLMPRFWDQDEEIDVYEMLKGMTAREEKVRTGWSALQEIADSQPPPPPQGKIKGRTPTL